jgi:hypothetical protein
MAAIQSSLELIEDTMTQIVLFPYHVFNHGRKKWKERNKEVNEEVGRTGRKNPQEDIEDGDAGSLKLLLDKQETVSSNGEMGEGRKTG